MAEPLPPTGPDFEAGVPLAELPEGVAVAGQAHGKPIVVVRRGTEVCAIGGKCTHYGGPLGEGLAVDNTVRCPWHHARFDVRTGRALGAPALNPVPCFEVRIEAERVKVGPEKSKPPVSAPPVAPASVVIVGGGAAGAAAAERLRDLGYAGPVTIVADEEPGPVDRPNLSKDYLAGSAPEDWIPLRTPDFYAQIGVDLLLGDPAVELDVRGRTVALRSGRRLAYEALLLATGAEPVRLPIEGATQSNVFTLRTLADSRAIIAAAAGQAEARRAVVIGSSFIGLETAASLRARGVEVDVVSRERLPLERVFGEQVGRFVRQLHEEHGVRFHLGTSPRALRAQSVELENGHSLRADFVVLGTGVRPRTALAEKAGLQVENGVVVDERLRTSVAGIWAAGDLARYPDPRTGSTVRIEHWVVAQRQGQAAARDMLGLGTPYRDTPFFWSQHYDVTFNYVGHAESWDAIEVAGSLAKRDATVTYRRSGRALAVLTIGRDQLCLALEAALERGDDAGIENLLRVRPAQAS